MPKIIKLTLEEPKRTCLAFKDPSGKVVVGTIYLRKDNFTFPWPTEIEITIKEAF